MAGRAVAMNKPSDATRGEPIQFWRQTIEQN
jgi:hypothetical protein